MQANAVRINLPVTLVSFGVLQVTQAARGWLQQVLRACPWLLWHTPLSARLAEVWDAEASKAQPSDRHHMLAGIVLRQVCVSPASAPSTVL